MHYTNEQKMVGGSMCIICLLFGVVAMIMGSWLLTVFTLFTATFSMFGGWMLEKLFGSPMPVEREPEGRSV